MSNYQFEFPEFNPNEMPKIPEGWTDQSWHNEVCPSFATNTGLVVYIDHAGPARREFPEVPRFTVQTEGNDPRVLVSTDKWGLVLATVDAHKSARFMRALNLSDDVIEDALNAAVLVVQKHLGITDGGYAGVHFSGDDRAGFTAIMRAYAQGEALDMAEEEAAGATLTAAEMAKAAGFEPWSTGGGCMAFHQAREPESERPEYILISDTSNGIDSDPQARVWLVGCHSEDGEAYVEIAPPEHFTLPEAIALAKDIPSPICENGDIADTFDTLQEALKESERMNPTDAQLARDHGF